MQHIPHAAENTSYKSNRKALLVSTSVIINYYINLVLLYNSLDLVK